MDNPIIKELESLIQIGYSLGWPSEKDTDEGAMVILEPPIAAIPSILNALEWVNSNRTNGFVFRIDLNYCLYYNEPEEIIRKLKLLLQYNLIQLDALDENIIDGRISTKGIKHMENLYVV